MTPQQAEAVQCAKEYGKPFRAKLLAAALDLGTEHASMLLKAAFDEGALRRTNIPNWRGGREWWYELEDQLWTPLTHSSCHGRHAMGTHHGSRPKAKSERSSLGIGWLGWPKCHPIARGHTTW
jgi:hypothetical protein